MPTEGVLRSGGFGPSASPRHRAHCHDSAARAQQHHLVLTSSSALHLLCGWHVCVSFPASLLGFLEPAGKATSCELDRRKAKKRFCFALKRCLKLFQT